jgi:hypothetical protein
VRPISNLARALVENGATGARDNRLLLSLYARESELAARYGVIEAEQHAIETEERELALRTRELEVRKREFALTSSQFEADAALHVFAVEGAIAATIAEGPRQPEPHLHLVRDDGPK